jgi:hypothetical protein
MGDYAEHGDVKKKLDFVVILFFLCLDRRLELLQ